MTDLHDLLDLATDRLEAPGLADRALTVAQRRRTVRRGVLASVAAVVLVVGVAVTTRLGGAPAVEPMRVPVTSPTGVPARTAPAIAPDRIQPVWGPRGAEGQPVVELGVPRVMESLTPGEVTRPVVLLDDGSRARLVSADGLVHELDLPGGLTRGRTVSLSPDGRRLVATGAGGFFWREIDGDWQRLGAEDVPLEAQLSWLPDSSGVIVRGWKRAVLVDLASGEVAEQRFLEGVSHLGVAPDGTLVGVTEGRSVVQWRDGRETDRVSTAGLEGLVLPAVGGSDLAFARTNLSIADPPEPADRDGLLALDRETFETRAYLPVPDDHYYVHAEDLRPLTWLDDDTLAFTVLPAGAAKRYLMTWDVETGDISRVSCWARSFDAVFATDLLGR